WHCGETCAVDGRDAIFRKELPQHCGVLIGDRGAELTEHPRWEAKTCRDGVKVSRTRACPGPYEQFMRVAGSDDLVHERVDGRATAVDDALAADLDHRCVRQDSEVCRRCRLRLKLRVRERSLYEERLELRRRVGHRFSISSLQSNALLGGGRQTVHKITGPHQFQRSLCRHAPAIA